jgi:hypothetical protein
MNAARLRLLIAAGLFMAWIGWLIYLATTTTNPVVLSRPQFLLSELDVVAQVDAGDVSDGERIPTPQVTVVAVLWSQDESDRRLQDQTITVENLPDIDRKHGWRGPTRYLLPLRKLPGTDRHFVIPPLGRSPGFPPAQESGYRPKEGDPRIYPDDPEVRKQLEQIRSDHWE